MDYALHIVIRLNLLKVIEFFCLQCATIFIVMSLPDFGIKKVLVSQNKLEVFPFLLALCCYCNKLAQFFLAYNAKNVLSHSL